MFQDYHGGVKNGAPLLDPLQNYELLSAAQNDTHTIISFQRQWDTCDSANDYVLGVSYQHTSCLFCLSMLRFLPYTLLLYQFIVSFALIGSSILIIFSFRIFIELIVYIYLFISATLLNQSHGLWYSTASSFVYFLFWPASERPIIIYVPLIVRTPLYL